MFELACVGGFSEIGLGPAELPAEMSAELRLKSTRRSGCRHDEPTTVEGEPEDCVVYSSAV